jgi:hypothetical protein
VSCLFLGGKTNVRSDVTQANGIVLSEIIGKKTNGGWGVTVCVQEYIAANTTHKQDDCSSSSFKTATDWFG